MNIVVGNVYHMRFSRQWFNVNSRYSIKTKTLFTRPVLCNGQEIWNSDMLPRVLKTAKKNTAHFTKYATFKTGGLFDQNPLKKAPGLIPLKAGSQQKNMVVIKNLELCSLFQLNTNLEKR